MNLSKLLYHFILALCLLIELTFSQTFPQAVTKYMATRQMRYHHYMWHQIRDNWNSFSASTQAAFTKIGWSCPNPARDSSGNMITNNYSGEDFLYMHRQMIATAKQVATQNGQALGTWFTGWTSIPAPGDTSYPVPAKSDLSSYKTTSYYNTLKSLETQFKDASKLKKMTLAQLGSQLESKIHNALHLRWAGTNSVGYRSGGSASSGVPNIAKKWDSINYDYLGDTYSSHVNQIFWKLHGWVDDRVEDWRKAHGLTSIKWSGTWTGGPMTSLGSALNRMKMGMTANNTEVDPEAVGDVLEEAMNLLAQSGVTEWTLEDAIKKDSAKKGKL